MVHRLYHIYPYIYIYIYIYIYTHTHTYIHTYTHTADAENFGNNEGVIAGNSRELVDQAVACRN
jgi:hypothetical protein